MQLTNYREYVHELPTDFAGASRNDFGRGFEDDDSFERPRRDDRPAGSFSDAPLLTHRRATALEDDDLVDIALHFGER